MCGAINLLTVINKITKRSYKKTILYNLGRLISYTLLGGIIGLIGSALTVNKTVTGVITLLVAIIIFLMALAMLIIHVDEEKLTGCNNEIYLAKYKIKKKLKVGDNIIEFTPTKEETLTYTCYMNMIKNNIKVINNKKYFERKS